MELKMTGRKAVVTGGSLGIGRAIAEAFSGSGAEVRASADSSERMLASPQSSCKTMEAAVAHNILYSTPTKTQTNGWNAFGHNIERLSISSLLASLRFGLSYGD